MWKRTTGQELQATTGGKPTKLTYEHAERLLLAQANHPEILPPGSHEVQKLGCTFMVSLLFYAWCGMAPASPACLPVCPLRQAPCRMPLLPAPHTRPQLGDNPESDIAGGNAAGFSTIVRSCFSLVFTLCAIPAEPLLLGPLLIAAYSLSGRACSAARTTTTSTPQRRCSRTFMCVPAIAESIGQLGPRLVMCRCESALTCPHLPLPSRRLESAGRSRRSSGRTLHCDAYADMSFARTSDNNNRAACAAEVQHGRRATRTTGRIFTWGCTTTMVLHCF